MDESVSDFQRRGFLSLQSEQNAQEFREISCDWAKCFLDVNECAQRTFHAIKLSERDYRRILAYSVFYRILTAYQSIFLLTQRGIDIESKVLLRTMTEALFVLKATVKVEDFASRYIRSDEDTRRRLLEKTMRVTEENLQRGEKLFVSQIGVEKMRRELQTLQAKRSARALVPEMKKDDIAREAGLENVYNTHFAFFSMFTHLTPTGMRQLFTVNESGQVTAFKCGTYYEDANANLRVAMVFMLSALSAVNEIFTLNISKDISELEERLERLTNSDEQNSD
jgi:hypothetical protein